MRFLALSVLLFVVPLSISCNVKKEADVQGRRIIDDSIRRASALDSLSKADFRAKLADHRNTFGIPSIGDSVDEAYQLFVEFSWGKSPVGALLSMLAEKRGSQYTLLVHTFPDRKRTESKMNMRESNFNRIRDFLDSVSFESQPMYHELDYTLHDASRYTIESFRDGKYHAISRSDSVDLYVYKLLAEVVDAAAISPELVKELRRAR